MSSAVFGRSEMVVALLPTCYLHERHLLPVGLLAYLPLIEFALQDLKFRMSDNDNEEYEVEFIREARVELSSRSKKAKLVWKYLVRWKNYTPADDTWEPTDSFIGSEHIVEAFWKRVHTGGRDVRDLSQFKAGETFRPVGPPKRPKGKSSNSAPVASSQEERPSTSNFDNRTSAKRRHDSPEIVEITDWSANRPRGHEPRRRSISSEVQSAKVADKFGKVQATHDKVSPIIPSHKKRRTRSPSIEIIPDSDEEANPSIRYPDLAIDSRPRRQSLRRNGDKSSLASLAVSSSLSEKDQRSSNVPLHQIRKDNPLVKMVEFDPGMMSGAISAKAQAVDRSISGSTANKPPKRTRPGPGRSSDNLMKSSLLTAGRSTLKTVKTKYRKRDNNRASPGISDQIQMEETGTIPQAPPRAEELLELAGLDAQAADCLPDFEEFEEAPKPLSPLPDNDKQGSSSKEARPSASGRFVIDANPLLETVTSIHDSDVILGLSMFGENPPNATSPSVAPKASFTRSTIFGPLTVWSEIESKQERSALSRFSLDLDASVSIPVILSASSPPDCFSSIVNRKGTPGKFYSTDAALTLLGTVRAVGASAFVSVDENEATEDEKVHFVRFSARLENGGLFVAMAGVQILALCSTSNLALSQRLNAPANLLNQPHKILVSRVDVENYSGYADAAANADNTRWVQYNSGE